MTHNKRDFSRVRTEMDRLVDNYVLPGISIAIQEDKKTVEEYCAGWADVGNKIPLTNEHLFRGFSSTKIVTACAFLKLLDKGIVDLDDRVEEFLPEFARLSVLRRNAEDIEDTEATENSITLRHLLTHTSGIGHDVVPSRNLIVDAYLSANVRDPSGTLSDMVRKISTIPLISNPGSEFNYGFSTDIVARVIEVADGRSFGTYLRDEIFDPLGMRDAGFWVSKTNEHLLTKLYTASDPKKTNDAGLELNVDDAFNEHLLIRPSLEMGGIGLIFSLSDKVKLLNALAPGSNQLLPPRVLKLLYENLMPEGLWVQFPGFIESPGTGHSAGGAIIFDAQPNEHPDTVGTSWWGGRAGTYWWISPKRKLSVAIMTHKLDAFTHPFGKSLINTICDMYAD